MKKEIKLQRLQKKAVEINEEILSLKYAIKRETEVEEIRAEKEKSWIDPSEQYMEAAQPVSPAIYKEDSGIADVDGTFPDHPVTRGIQY